MIVLLLLHDLSAVFLLGAVTHQVFALWWPAPRASRPGWWQSLRTVHADRYALAVVVLFAVTVLLGAVLYPPFRSIVRFEYLDQQAPRITGLFEIKEHAAAIGLALLPAYWRSWRDPGTRSGPRRAFTTALALATWWNFVVGHIVNNARGL